MDPVCSHQTEIDILPKTFHCKAVACTMEVPVVASADRIFMEQIHNLITAVSLIQRRIVEKRQNRFPLCRF